MPDLLIREVSLSEGAGQSGDMTGQCWAGLQGPVSAGRGAPTFGVLGLCPPVLQFEGGQGARWTALCLALTPVSSCHCLVEAAQAQLPGLERATKGSCRLSRKGAGCSDDGIESEQRWAFCDRHSHPVWPLRACLSRRSTHVPELSAFQVLTRRSCCLLLMLICHWLPSVSSWRAHRRAGWDAEVWTRPWEATPHLSRGP